MKTIVKISLQIVAIIVGTVAVLGAAYAVLNPPYLDGKWEAIGYYTFGFLGQSAFGLTLVAYGLGVKIPRLKSNNHGSIGRTIHSGPSRHPSQWQRQFEGAVRYLEIPENANVLIVEDSLARLQQFKRWLPQARIVSSADRAVEAIRKNPPTILFLDRDLIGPSYGEKVADFIAAEKFAGQVYVTSANPFGIQAISKILDGKVKFEAIPFSMLGIVRVPKAVENSAKNGGH